MITFKSVGHFFATAFKAIVKDLPAIEGTKTVVEGVTASIDPAIIPVENAAYAVLGEIASVLTAGGAAATAKLQDAGLDVAVIDKVKSVMAGAGSLIAVAKTLTK